MCFPPPITWSSVLPSSASYPNHSHCVLDCHTYTSCRFLIAFWFPFRCAIFTLVAFLFLLFFRLLQSTFLYLHGSTVAKPLELRNLGQSQRRRIGSLSLGLEPLATKDYLSSSSIHPFTPKAGMNLGRCPVLQLLIALFHSSLAPSKAKDVESETPIAMLTNGQYYHNEICSIDRHLCAVIKLKQKYPLILERDRDP